MNEARSVPRKPRLPLSDRSGKVSKGVVHPAAVVTFVLVLAVGFWSWPFTVDDAYVVARYAVRLAEGKGYTMNDGPPSDGVTGPLWIVPLAAARALGLDPVVIAKSFGLGCMALAAACRGPGYRIQVGIA